MSRPRTVSDEEIIAAARRCFIERGAQVSTQVIADAVGLSQPALFKRFGTKNALLFRSLLPVGEPAFVGLMESGPDPERDICEQLIDIGLAVGSFFEQLMPAMMTLSHCGGDLVRYMSQNGEPPPLLARRALRDWFIRADELGAVRAEDPDAMTLAFIGALQSRAFMAHLLRVPLEVGVEDQDIETYVCSLVRGLFLGMNPAYRGGE